MKIIETDGITYLEKFDSCSEWYWGCNYASGDFNLCIACIVCAEDDSYL